MKKKKITLEVPKTLLNKAMKATGEGITLTVKKALEAIIRNQAYEDLRKLRGKVKFSYNYKALRN